MTRWWLLALGIAAVGCKDDSTHGETPPARPQPTPAAVTPAVGTAVAPGTVRGPANTLLSVVVPAGGDVDQLAARARRDLAAAHVAVGTDAITLAEVKTQTVADAGWSREMAPYMGDNVPEADHARIDAAAGALTIFTETDASHALIVLREAGGVAAALAEACHGWVIDAGTGNLHTGASLAAGLPTATGFDIRTLIALHSSADEDEMPAMDSLGMRQLGLPELFIKDIPPAYLPHVAAMVNATAQTLALRGDVTRAGELVVDVTALGPDWHGDDLVKAGGSGTITWRVRWSTGLDAPGATVERDELLIELDLRGARAGDATALVAALDAYGGKVDDTITTIDGGDPELLAAGERARKDLRALRPRFAHEFPVGERLAIKARFATRAGEVEWMWVDVSTWKGDRFGGTLDNDPQIVTTLKAGQRVKVQLADVADYIHVKADGTEAGGYSVAIFKRRGKL